MDDISNLQTGFGSYIQSEAIPNTLPQGQNSPQHVAFNLYAEQISGSAFTQPRHRNLRGWLYRTLPSVAHGNYKPTNHRSFNEKNFKSTPIPNQLRWSAIPDPKPNINFIEGINCQLVAGSAKSRQGMAVHLCAASESMQDCYFFNSDGEFIWVPYQGTARFKTEFGSIVVKPNEILVIPRGITFQVEIIAGPIKGYLGENYGHPFILPDLGPIGSNGLAAPRDFVIPNASFEDKAGKFELICKLNNQLFTAKLNHSPLNVVAWHGNYYPYHYSLNKFNTINSVSFDHCDPSIFTVLTSPTSTPGLANVDFVIFPERWLVAEHTFRPPYYHRNVMSEYMGLIKGKYDAKSQDFMVGGSSCHNCMVAHGPDSKTFQQAIDSELKPEKLANTMAFMFETSLVWEVTNFGLNSGLLQKDYLNCWSDLKNNFKD